jgi:hypothetical protein
MAAEYTNHNDRPILLSAARIGTMRDRPRHGDTPDEDHRLPEPEGTGKTGVDRIVELVSLTRPDLDRAAFWDRPGRPTKADAVKANRDTADKPADRSESSDPRVPANIRKLLDLQGPRPADQQPPTGWDAPEVIDHPQRPDPESIRLGDERRTHILDGDATGGGHRHGTGSPGRTEFPANWSDDTMTDYVASVARSPEGTPYFQPWGSWRASATRDGVEVNVVIKPDGQIWTAWPTEGGDGVLRNPKEHS